jgi:hypothetical protein
MGLSFFHSVPGLALCAGTDDVARPQELLQFRGKNIGFPFYQYICNTGISR